MTAFLRESSESVSILDDGFGNDVIMVRVDKTLTNLMEAEPYSRWDPHFWHPKYTNLEGSIKNYPGGFTHLSSLLENNEVLSCDHVRASKGEAIGKYRTAYYTVDWILSTGYDSNQLVFCSDNAFKRLKRSALRKGDIAIAGSGKGSVGKSFIYLGEHNKAVVGDLFILRTESINPFFLQVLLQSKIFQLQIERHESGVSGQTHINQREIESFLIPLFPAKLQEQVEAEYAQVHSLHVNAMETIAKGKKINGETLLAQAQTLLNQLVSLLESHLGLE